MYLAQSDRVVVENGPFPLTVDNVRPDCVGEVDVKHLIGFDRHIAIGLHGDRLRQRPASVESQIESADWAVVAAGHCRRTVGRVDLNYHRGRRGPR